jgi:hypothetical protein
MMPLLMSDEELAQWWKLRNDDVARAAFMAPIRKRVAKQHIEKLHEVTDALSRRILTDAAAVSDPDQRFSHPGHAWAHAALMAKIDSVAIPLIESSVGTAPEGPNGKTQEN